MRITPLHASFIMPSKSTEFAGAIDLYMPEAGVANGESKLVGLGFAAAIPFGHVGLLLPRSGVGAKFGVELNNTCGVIDADYRGEWMAALKTKSGIPYSWKAGDRLLQCVVVPVLSVQLELVDSIEALGITGRGAGGYGSSGA
jgi:dUTP pyrophosphatase